MATNKQQENAKKKFARNQQIVASLRAGMLGKWRTNMVSAIPGQRSSVHV
jgi:hypothetical protein